jgi:hypothetical protein
MMPEGVLFSISIVVFLAAMLKQIFETNAFFRHLEKEHPDTFRELGGPKWGIQFGDMTFRNAMKYIHSGAFEVLEDEILSRHYRSMRSAEKLAYFVAAVAMATALFEAVKASL